MGQEQASGNPLQPPASVPPPAAAPPTPPALVSGEGLDRGLVARRWLHFVLVLLLVTVIGCLALGLRGKLGDATRPYFDTLSTWTRHAACILACAVVVYLLSRLMNPSLAHVNSRALHYPPMWCAFAIAAVTICVIDLVVGIGPAGFEGMWREWLLYPIPACLAVWLLTWSGRVERHKKISPKVADAPERTLEQIADSPEALRAWYESEGSASEDLLGTKPMARSLAEYLRGDLGRPRTVGLVGGFGTGKTSIARWVREELEKPRPTGRTSVWVCEVNCWGFEDSASAAEHILKRAVEEVGKTLDCFSFRNLPDAYRKTFSAGGDWVRSLSEILFGATDPYEQFDRLSQLLAFAKARLVIVVEDVDRNKSGKFDPGEILALLSRLREYPSLSFILTGSAGIDFPKLCERIQHVPSISVSRALRIITAFRAQERVAFAADVAPYGTGENPWSPSNALLQAVYEINPQGRALCRLLRTPRELKLVVRHAHHAWQTLHGEVDFDHLLAITALQHTAGSAVSFLQQYRDQLFVDPTELSTTRDRLPALQERLRAAWAACTAGVQWDTEAALELLLFMIPHAGTYFGVQRPRETIPPQGIGRRNYLERIIAENIAPGELSDQEVLRAARDWTAAPSPAAHLVTRLRTCPEFAEAWEHFALLDPTWEGDRVLRLASDYFSILDSHDTREGPHDRPPAFIALWRIAHRRVRPSEVTYHWLECQILDAMARSLPFALDLYYYWASQQYGILPPGGRAKMRTLISDRAKAQFTSAAALLNVLHLEQPYEIYQLVFPPGDEQGEEMPLRGAQHWSWLGPILYDALVANPRLMAPKIAGLISEQVHGEVVGEYRAATVQERLLAFFPKNAPDVIRIMSEVRSQFEGQERIRLDQVVNSAATTPQPSPVELS